MKAARTQTVAALARVEKIVQRDSLEAQTRKAPDFVAGVLSKSPNLLNGYQEADVLIDVLFEAGMTQALETILASGQCSRRVRRLIANKLMFH